MGKLRRSPLVLLAVLLAGCGVKEYEAEFEKTRQRLVYLDRENELLAPPVGIPSSAPVVSLRLPVGFATQPSKIESDGEWWSFPWSAGPPGAFALFVGVASPEAARGMDDWVRAFLKSQAAGEIETREPIRNEPAVREADPPERRRAIDYRRLALRAEEKPERKESPLPEPLIFHYDAYLHQAQGVAVAVVVKRLDRRATEQRWQGKEEKLLQSLLPAEAVARQVAEAVPFCLATLRRGAASKHGRAENP